MGVIYEPAGRAREYAALACNLYSGCEHGCAYCYAPSALRRNREEFHQRSLPRVNVIQELEKDCRRLAGRENPRVLLCFSCDPYGPQDAEYGITRRAIETLHRYGLCAQILTKGGMRAARDFDLLTERDAFAVTLTFTSENDSREWEPKAVLPVERYEVLREAHRRGIPTWASLEPVIDPEQSLRIILDTCEFVDLYKIGKLNYRPEAKGIDWARFARSAMELLERLGKDYYLKRDLCDEARMPYRERAEAAYGFSSEASASQAVVF